MIGKMSFSSTLKTVINTVTVIIHSNLALGNGTMMKFKDKERGIFNQRGC